MLFMNSSNPSSELQMKIQAGFRLGSGRYLKSEMQPFLGWMQTSSQSTRVWSTGHRLHRRGRRRRRRRRKKRCWKMSRSWARKRSSQSNNGHFRGPYQPPAIAHGAKRCSECLTGTSQTQRRPSTSTSVAAPSLLCRTDRTLHSIGQS